MWSTLLYAPNLVFFLVCVALALWALMRGSLGQKAVGIALLINASRAGSVPDPPGIGPPPGLSRSG